VTPPLHVDNYKKKKKKKHEENLSTPSLARQLIQLCSNNTFAETQSPVMNANA
jgi:hypothetical protein